LKQVEGKTQLLIDFAIKSQKIPDDIIIAWINLKTSGEGWTALHYASF
jgi:hypothetical protein